MNNNEGLNKGEEVTKDENSLEKKKNIILIRMEVPHTGKLTLDEIYKLSVKDYGEVVWASEDVKGFEGLKNLSDEIFSTEQN